MVVIKGCAANLFRLLSGMPGKIPQGFTQVRVHGHIEHKTIRFLRHVNDPYNILKMPVFGKKLRQHVPGFQQKPVVEHRVCIFRIEGEDPYAGFHKVLEEVGSERELGHVPSLCHSHLHQGRCVVDFGIGYGNAQLDVAAAAPASRAYQDELALGENGIQHAHQPGCILHVLRVFETAVVLGINIHDMGYVFYQAV